MTALAIPQPEYRALMMFDQIPEGCTTFLCTNVSTMPHVRPGETVIIDTRDRTPSAGELFVIKFGEQLRNHHICLVSLRPDRCVHAKPGDKVWSVGAARNVEVKTAMDIIKSMNISDTDKARLILDANVAAGGWAEGPYSNDPESVSYQHLCHCLVGRVIGIYAPGFEGPSRTI